MQPVVPATVISGVVSHGLRGPTRRSSLVSGSSESPSQLTMYDMAKLYANVAILRAGAEMGGVEMDGRTDDDGDMWNGLMQPVYDSIVG